MSIVKPVLYPTNILETAILRLLPDGAVSGKGAERLADRDIGLECEDAGIAGTRTWHADQGLTPKAAGTAIVIGSGYAGKLITFASSPDDSAWTTRGSVTPVADTAQRVDFAGGPFTARYWRMTIAGGPVPIRFTEWFLTVGVSLTFKPSAPNLREGATPQVVQVQSGTGRAWGIKRGDRRWSHRYVMTYSPDTDRQAVLALLSDIEDGAKPCWIRTVTDEMRWVRVPGAIDFSAADRGVAEWDIPLEPVEELP